MVERPMISMKYQRYLIVTLLPINSRESSFGSESAAGIGVGENCGLDFLRKQSNNAYYFVRWEETRVLTNREPEPSVSRKSLLFLWRILEIQ